MKRYSDHGATQVFSLRPRKYGLDISDYRFGKDSSFFVVITALPIIRIENTLGL